MSIILLIFGKEPIPGTVKSRLIPHMGDSAATELYRRMQQDVLQRTVAVPAADRIFWYQGNAGEWLPESIPTHLQRGKDLGERMEHAFAAAFEAGAERVVIIGTDSPDLPLEFIGSAFELLAEHDVVAGPAEDGGYYLLGMRRVVPELFREMPWSTAEVLAETVRRAKQAGLRTALLPEWYDVDSPEDLQRPGLVDPENRAPLTREFLLSFKPTSGACTPSP